MFSNMHTLNEMTFWNWLYL